MGYTTYLLGAGASANAIPTYFSKENNFTLKFIIFIHKYFSRLKGNLVIENEITFALIKEIEKEGSKHYTLDTYARKLYLSNDENSQDKLRLLKMLISNFLEYWQIPKKNQTQYEVVDYRYDVLMSSILEKSDYIPKLSESIKFISWNYDNQLEMALLNFNDSTFTQDMIRSDYKFYPIIKITPDNQGEPIQIVKLNGLAGQYISKINKNILSNYGQDSGIANFEIRFKKALSNYKQSDYLINFAWENNDISKLAIENSKEILKNTDKLIVIGYSFPGYNHDIDMDLFSSLKYPAKILYQSGDKNSANEKRKIKSLFTGNYKEAAIIEHTDYCDNFILPFQFDQFF